MEAIERERRLRACLEGSSVSRLVGGWLAEDVPSLDVGGAVLSGRRVEALLRIKSPGVLAGKTFVEAVFAAVGVTEVRWTEAAVEGVEIHEKDLPCILAVICGEDRKVLLGERTALNILARCSGVATRARTLVQLVQRAGWAGNVAGTRKTTPGFRLVEKYGMIVGGADPHRFDLSSMVMLKDNHMACCAGGVGEAIATVRSLAGFSVKIEVECGTVGEAIAAAKAGADIVMLDNFVSKEFWTAAETVKAAHPAVLVEGSGGLSEANLVQYCCPAADILSLSIAQNFQVVDFSLKVAITSA
mmetsp:Transcript_14274/g.29222  ORF Transcript_14274/g.29222 Transcript_14274/m.29222 type:complete len:301 (-) Transcript_14274:1827-2729(-)